MVVAHRGRRWTGCSQRLHAIVMYFFNINFGKKFNTFNLPKKKHIKSVGALGTDLSLATSGKHAMERSPKLRLRSNPTRVH